MLLPKFQEKYGLSKAGAIQEVFYKSERIFVDGQKFVIHPGSIVISEPVPPFDLKFNDFRTYGEGLAILFSGKIVNSDLSIKEEMKTFLRNLRDRQLVEQLINLFVGKAFQLKYGTKLCPTAMILSRVSSLFTEKSKDYFVGEVQFWSCLLHFVFEGLDMTYVTDSICARIDGKYEDEVSAYSIAQVLLRSRFSQVFSDFFKAGNHIVPASKDTIYVASIIDSLHEALLRLSHKLDEALMVNDALLSTLSRIHAELFSFTSLTETQKKRFINNSTYTQLRDIFQLQIAAAEQAIPIDGFAADLWNVYDEDVLRALHNARGIKIMAIRDVAARVGVKPITRMFDGKRRSVLLFNGINASGVSAKGMYRHTNTVSKAALELAYYVPAPELYVLEKFALEMRDLLSSEKLLPKIEGFIEQVGGSSMDHTLVGIGAMNETELIALALHLSSHVYISIRDNHSDGSDADEKAALLEQAIEEERLTYQLAHDQWALLGGRQSGSKEPSFDEEAFRKKWREKSKSRKLSNSKKPALVTSDGKLIQIVYCGVYDPLLDVGSIPNFIKDGMIQSTSPYDIIFSCATAQPGRTINLSDFDSRVDFETTRYIENGNTYVNVRLCEEFEIRINIPSLSPNAISVRTSFEKLLKRRFSKDLMLDNFGVMQADFFGLIQFDQVLGRIEDRAHVSNMEGGWKVVRVNIMKDLVTAAHSSELIKHIAEELLAIVWSSNVQVKMEDGTTRSFREVYSSRAGALSNFWVFACFRRAAFMFLLKMFGSDDAWIKNYHEMSKNIMLWDDINYRSEA